VCLLNAPGRLQRSFVSDDVRVAYDLRRPVNDVVVLFVTSLEELEKRITHVLACGSRGGETRVACRWTSCAASRSRRA
jgi:hypothetical protein